MFEMENVSGFPNASLVIYAFIVIPLDSLSPHIIHSLPQSNPIIPHMTCTTYVLVPLHLA